MKVDIQRKNDLNWGDINEGETFRYVNTLRHGICMRVTKALHGSDVVDLESGGTHNYVPGTAIERVNCKLVVIAE
jgi:hypothetical protein